MTPLHVNLPPVALGANLRSGQPDGFAVGRRLEVWRQWIAVRCRDLDVYRSPALGAWLIGQLGVAHGGDVITLVLERRFVRGDWRDRGARGDAGHGPMRNTWALGGLGREEDSQGGVVTILLS